MRSGDEGKSDHPIRSYRFSDDILKRVRRCYDNDNWHGPLEFAQHWLIVVASIVVSLWAWSHLPLVPAALIYALAVWFIGSRPRALADILHQAAHRTLMRNSRIGRILGTYFSGYLVLQSYTGYLASHIREHHGQLGDPSVDPDYLQYQRNGLCGDGMNPASVRRYLLRIVTPRVMLRYLVYLLRDRIANKQEDGRERVRRLLYLAGLVTGLLLLGGWKLIALYWLVPLITSQVWIGSLIELVEHYPMIESAPRLDLYVSRNRHCGRLPNFLLGVTPHEGYHLIHHKFAAVPPWRHHQVHAILMEDPEYAAVNTTRGWRAILREVITLQAAAQRPGTQEARPQ